MNAACHICKGKNRVDHPILYFIRHVLLHYIYFCAHDISPLAAGDTWWLKRQKGTTEANIQNNNNNNSKRRNKSKWRISKQQNGIGYSKRSQNYGICEHVVERFSLIPSLEHQTHYLWLMISYCPTNDIRINVLYTYTTPHVGCFGSGSLLYNTWNSLPYLYAKPFFVWHCKLLLCIYYLWIASSTSLPIDDFYSHIARTRSEPLLALEANESRAMRTVLLHGKRCFFFHSRFLPTFVLWIIVNYPWNDFSMQCGNAFRNGFYFNSFDCI